MERAESSPELAEAGTEQSGISSDEAEGRKLLPLNLKRR